MDLNDIEFDDSHENVLNEVRDKADALIEFCKSGSHSNDMYRKALGALSEHELLIAKCVFDWVESSLELSELKQTLTRLDAFLSAVPDGLGEAVNWDTGRMSKFIEFKNKHGYEPHQVVHIGSTLLHSATRKGDDDE